MTALHEKWLTIPLSDIANVESGNPAPQGTEHFSDNGVPFVRVQDMGRVGNQKYLNETRDRVSVKGQEGLKLFPRGTVLFTKSGASTLLNQRALLASESYIVSHIGTAIPRTGVESEWIYYFLKTVDFAKFAHGANMPSLPLSRVQSLMVPIAGTALQRRIIAKIEGLFSELDKGVESLTTAREQLKIYRKSVLERAFQSVAEHIQLDQVSEAVGGFAFKSTEFNQEGKYQVLRMGNIRPGQIRSNEAPVFVDHIDPKLLTRYLLKRGDVLITLTGTRNKRDYGYTAIVDADDYLVNQRIAYLRFKPNYLSKFFLYFSWTRAFQDQFFGSETGNVGQGNVGMGAIRSSVVPFADVSDQGRIVSQLDASLTAIDRVREEIDEQLTRAFALRQLILKRAFSGQLVHPDAADEPASVLLDRIRAEREGGGATKRRDNKNGKEAA